MSHEELFSWLYTFAITPAADGGLGWSPAAAMRADMSDIQFAMEGKRLFRALADKAGKSAEMTAERFDALFR